MSKPAHFLKLGLSLEYLRGIDSASSRAQNDLSNFPYLLDNQAPLRYGAAKIVAVLNSLLGQLKELKLNRTLDAAADFEPMRIEVEEFLSQAPNPGDVTLQDHFAEKLVTIAENVLKTLREEIASAG